MAAKGCLFLVVVAVYLLACLPFVHCTPYEWYVSPSNTTGDGSEESPFATIAEALAGVTKNDSIAIHLGEGLYKGEENIGLHYEAGAMYIFGPVDGLAVLDCEGAALGMEMASTQLQMAEVSLQLCATGISFLPSTESQIIGCSFSDMPGTAISADDATYLELRECTFNNVMNNSVSGQSLTWRMVDSTFSGPTGGGGGGGIAVTKSGSGTVESCLFKQIGGVIGSSRTTQAFTADGGIWHFSGLFVDQCALRADTAAALVDEDATGGAFKLYDSSGEITASTMYAFSNCSFLNNRVDSGSGGAIAFGPGANATLDGVLFDGNTAQDGGAIYLAAKSDVMISDTVFGYNVASDVGGAIYADESSTLYLSNTTFTGNTATVASADISCCNDGTSCSAGVYVGDGVTGVSNSTSDCVINEWEDDDSGDDSDSGPQGWVVGLVVLAIVLFCIVLVLIAAVAKRMHSSHQERKAYDIVD